MKSIKNDTNVYKGKLNFTKDVLNKSKIITFDREHDSSIFKFEVNVTDGSLMIEVTVKGYYKEIKLKGMYSNK